MSLKQCSILVIDDDKDVLTALSLLLKRHVAEVTVEKNPENIWNHFSKKRYDLVLLDMNFNARINTGNEGLYWLSRIKEIQKDLPVILITAYADINLAIKSLKDGAEDFVIKPWDNQKLIESISQIVNRKTSKIIASEVNFHANGLLGESEVMKSVFYKIEKVAPTDANILILGENGTGKDVIAKTIHDCSLRKTKPFVKVDVGALTESLFESELFGHKKGAFTDAREDRMGLIEAANGGTLFLDEIGNISLQQQAKLLSVLQNRQVIRLGTNQIIPLDIRLLCATNLPLNELANEQKFRKDLIYRINTVDVIVPPLRMRSTDIVLLAKHFLNFYAGKYFKRKVSFSQNALDKLKTYTFPGNVRELQYCIERAMIMAEEDVINEDDLVFSPIEHDFKGNALIDNETALSVIEKKTIQKVIEKNKGNISKAAKELGITRTALYRRLNKYEI